MLRIGQEPCRVPVGAMFIWLTDTAPAGWLLCYGQQISRAIYAKLFGIIGTTFGIGDGSTTFNLPDLRGRLPLGQDDMGGTPANRITNAQADTIGGSSGSESHTLTIAEMPAHTHIIEVWKSDGGIGEERFYHFQGTSSDTNATLSTGGGDAHNNVQPYLTTNYIIKY